ncbi:probable nuclear hormone receptor HR3 [Hyalella azteca]|uniref:Probable nuclear hormone receptor HR3 n=1 Tax=Hyalella azteca TaxID=294128 RepID=A0A8B7PEZ0_HYAAZ|nr:probable nuclear hormone receptor HR3 [Hyalella azteca]
MDGPPLDPGGDSSPPSSSPFSPCRGDRQWKTSEAVPAAWQYRKAVGGLRSPPLVGGSCSPPDVPLQGGSLSHDMEVLIKQEVDGLDVGGLQSPHVTGDEGDDGASSDLLGSVDSTTVLPFLSSGDGSPQPNAPLVPHQYQGGDLHDFHPHHLPQHHQHLQHHQHHHQQHQQQLVQREFTNNIPGFIHMTNQEQAIRTSAMLYEDIIAGYETDEVSNVLARLLGSAMRESVETLGRRAPLQDNANYFAKMRHEDVWMDTARTLADVMQLIIEFAKLVPGFRKFPQADQINLLKCGGGFEIALVWMSRNYDLQKDCVLYNNCYVPASSFATKDKLEEALVKDVYQFGHTLAQLKLCEKELGLFAAIVLLQAGKYV